MKNENDILNELNDLGSPLASMSKTNIFVVPDGYFETLVDNLFDEIEEFGCTASWSKGMPLAPPLGYFEGLPAQILEGILIENKPTKSVPLGRQVWLLARWAAAALLILGIGIGSLKTFILPSNPEKAITRLPQGSIDAYVQQHIDEFSTEMIMTNFPAGKQNALLKSAFSPLKDEEITQYLENNNTDQSELE